MLDLVRRHARVEALPERVALSSDRSASPTLAAASATVLPVAALRMATAAVAFRLISLVEVVAGGAPVHVARRVATDPAPASVTDAVAVVSQIGSSVPVDKRVYDFDVSMIAATCAQPSIAVS